jgi:hypothetical protein
MIINSKSALNLRILNIESKRMMITQGRGDLNASDTKKIDMENLTFLGDRSPRAPYLEIKKSTYESEPAQGRREDG